MAEKLELEIITSTGETEKVNIKDIYIPAYNGEAGILQDHLPYISVLKSGEIRYDDLDGKGHFLYIDEGFIETAGNRIVIISDSVTKGEKLDENDINEQLHSVQSRIKSSLKGEITPEELAKELELEKKLKIKLSIIKKLS